MTDQVFDILRDRIINLELKPGGKVNFDELQKELGISKTPLKQALQRLEYEEFVVIRPRYGTYISTPSKENLSQLYELREAIEAKAVQLGAGNIPRQKILDLQKEVLQADLEIEQGDFSLFLKTDVKMHNIFNDYSDNSYIKKVKEMIDSHVHWYRVLGATSKGRAYKSSERHKELLEAVLDNNIQKASEVMANHIQEVKEATLEDIDELYFQN